MENLGFGQILLLIAFIVLPLINFAMQRLRRRVEHQTPNHEAVTQMRRQAPAPAAPPGIPRASRKEAQETILATSLPRERRASFKGSLLGNARDVRRGIIVMTILGPCRTFDPLN
jgi:hypothetical protein